MNPDLSRNSPLLSMNSGLLEGMVVHYFQLMGLSTVLRLGSTCLMVSGLRLRDSSNTARKEQDLL